MHAVVRLVSRNWLGNFTGSWLASRRSFTIVFRANNSHSNCLPTFVTRLSHAQQTSFGNRFGWKNDDFLFSFISPSPSLLFIPFVSFCFSLVRSTFLPVHRVDSFSCSSPFYSRFLFIRELLPSLLIFDLFSFEESRLRY